jgi:CRP-like cAMP-binding protein
MDTNTKKSYMWSSLFQPKKKNLLSEALRKVTIFQDLSKSELKEIEELGHIRSYSKGEYIFYKGEPSYGFYIILKGGIQILRGNQEIIRLKSSEMFGQFAMIEKSKRTASAKSIDNTKLFYIYSSDLKKMFKGNPSLGLKIHQRMLVIIGKILEEYDEGLYCKNKK